MTDEEFCRIINTGLDTSSKDWIYHEMHYVNSPCYNPLYRFNIFLSKVLGD